MDTCGTSQNFVEPCGDLNNHIGTSGTLSTLWNHVQSVGTLKNLTEFNATLWNPLEPSGIWNLVEPCRMPLEMQWKYRFKNQWNSCGISENLREPQRTMANLCAPLQPLVQQTFTNLNEPQRTSTNLSLCEPWRTLANLREPQPWRSPLATPGDPWGPLANLGEP